MTQNEFSQIVENLGALSPEQRQELRRALDRELVTDPHQPGGPGPGSIGAMRDDAELLDQAVAHAMQVREERPWRLTPGE